METGLQSGSPGPLDEPTENKKSGNKKQEHDQETAKRPKQDQTDSKAHRLSKT